MEYSEKNKNALQKAINELPQFEPDGNLWSSIENKLDKLKQKPRIIKFNRWYWAASIAATVLLLMVYVWDYKFNYNDKENIQMVYSSEENEPVHFKKDNTENLFALALQHIKEYCTTEPELCKDTVFIAMNDQLSEIDLQIYKTQNIINNHPDQPELIKFKHKLEKEKNKTIKQMIHLINS